MKFHCTIKNAFFLYLLLSACNLGCKKFVAVDPPKTQIVTASVYSNDGSAISAMNGIYSQMISSAGFASGGYVSVTLLGGLSSDEFINYSASAELETFYANNLNATNLTLAGSLWQEPYQYIYYANAVLDGLSISSGVSAKTHAELEGEAKFIRAFCHFYLVNLFGDIPLVLSTDYRINAVLPRTPKEKVYQQIISDLTDAQGLLPADYSFSNGERVKPNKWAATALLARTYLYTADWVHAESASTSVITNTSYSVAGDLDNVFLANSEEAIWQLMPVLPESNTNEGINFILTGTPNSVAISKHLLNAFEPGDKRKQAWVNYYIDGMDTFYYPYKYKIQASGEPVTEYSMVLRLAEQYLIRSEARARQNNITGAQTDLNIIRARAGLANTTATTETSLLAAILHERQIELFSEWGHRWLDLKRTTTADGILGPIKQPNWQSSDILYPIPQSELKNDIKLTQNPGY